LNETRLGPGFMETLEENFPFFLEQIKHLANPPEPEIEVSRLELFAILLLKQAKTCNMGTLAKGLSVPMSTATGIAERLEKKGLILRTKSEEDRRAIILQLQTKGEELVAKYFQHIGALIAGWKSNLTPEEFEIFSILLRKMLAGNQNKKLLRVVK